MMDLRWRLAFDVDVRVGDGSIELSAPGRPIATLPEPSAEFSAPFAAFLTPDGLDEAAAEPLMPLLLRLARARMVE